MPSAYHCTLCKDETLFKGPLHAIEEGWVLSELRGPTGNKYACFCPGHTSAEMVASLTEMLGHVVITKDSKKKS